ncbi:hypothetical protein [Aureimonas altamirensis]|jgi:hypothetical protein|uniref:hypothetical protein n=1 Tax=Aureimonas altamirensis TaxID=370622 RepID=UPI00301AA097
MHDRSQRQSTAGATAASAVAAILSVGLVAACIFGIGPFGGQATAERVAVYAP